MILSDFDGFKTNQMVKFKEEMVEGVSYTIISYMISDKSFWDTPLADETRGITFETDTGKCVSRPFNKFYRADPFGEVLEELPFKTLVEARRNIIGQ